MIVEIPDTYAKYLDDLLGTHLFGRTRDECVERLLSVGVRTLIGEGTLTNDEAEKD